MMKAYRTTSALAPRKTVGNCFRPRRRRHLPAGTTRRRVPSSPVSSIAKDVGEIVCAERRLYDIRQQVVRISRFVRSRLSTRRYIDGDREVHRRAEGSRCKSKPTQHRRVYDEEVLHSIDSKSGEEHASALSSLPVSARKSKHGAKLAAKNFGQKVVAELTAPCLPPSIELPRLVNQETMQYTKPEAVNWLTEHTAKKTTRRARAIDLMIKLGYAPASVRTLQRLLKSKEQGDLVLDDGWGDSASGRKRKMTESDLDEVVSTLTAGETTGLKE
ncbi:hypothetical protein THAOC_19212 [Thalassiosira oceanica]|uniref:Uncharacterized protein n=1 Tax=Thalassiosira oceanica TaxID=159749 RepID=K0S2V5_THAOC|nr:hypothetical protein THAOC_19212 [Thalassiosira oceanica]|eukprot:EJK60438.1 hypothetical protein THAOC_19212 [Thalassiosira oceanica]